MSIRIHELAKKIGMDNKQLLTLLQGRNFEVKSVSSSIDNISADALVAEFAKPEDATAPVEPEADSAKPSAKKNAAEKAPSESEAAELPATPTVNLPAGVFVKTPADIAREKAEKVAAAEAEASALAAEKAAAAKAAREPKPIAPPPPPASGPRFRPKPDTLCAPAAPAVAQARPARDSAHCHKAERTHCLPCAAFRAARLECSGEAGCDGAGGLASGSAPGCQRAAATRHRCNPAAEAAALVAASASARVAASAFTRVAASACCGCVCAEASANRECRPCGRQQCRRRN